MQFMTILGDDCHVVSCMGNLFFVYELLFIGRTSVATLLSKAYHWEAFMEAENKARQIKYFIKLQDNKSN